MTDAVLIEPAGRVVRLRLRVKPGARRNRLIGAHGGALKLEVQAAPERGRANDAVVAMLAEVFDVPRSLVSVVSGSTSRDKVVEVVGCSVDGVVARLREAGIEALGP